MMLCASVCITFAQGRATTVEEYKYLTSGQLNTILPYHQLRKTGVSVTLPFMDVSRTVTIYELYRQDANTPCALLLVYHKNDENVSAYLCVPDIQSDSSLWNAYRKQLTGLNDTGNALETITYALSIYLAKQ